MSKNNDLTLSLLKHRQKKTLVLTTKVFLFGAVGGT